MQTTIQQWGNSAAIRLPKGILDVAELGKNEPVIVVAEPNKITIEKINRPKHRTFAERVASFQGDYVFKEADTGSDVGSEIW
jgi:antitoxin MazE